MTRRKGLGRGKGKGFKNIIPKIDRRTHSNSARGIKQPQMKDEKMLDRFARINKPRESSFSAKTVLEQLGGNRFIAMTGANTFMKDDNNYEMSFRIPRAKDGINFVKIRLNGKDLYDMEFGMIRGFKYFPKKTVNDVYNDQLQDMFTENTGLYTSL